MFQVMFQSRRCFTSAAEEGNFGVKMAPKKPEYETLNSKLLKEDYEIVNVIKDMCMPEGLTELLMDYVKGKYSNMAVVPSEIAFRGSEWQLMIPSHIVYVRYSPKGKRMSEKKHDPQHINFHELQPEFKNIYSREEKFIHITRL